MENQLILKIADNKYIMGNHLAIITKQLKRLPDSQAHWLVTPADTQPKPAKELAYSNAW